MTNASDKTKSRMHVTYWIHPDMNRNIFHILTVIACVRGYLIEDVCFSPFLLPFSSPSLLSPSLSTSPLRTSLSDVYPFLKEEDFCDRGSPAMQAHNMHSQGSVYIVHILCMEPLCNPEHPCTKYTTSLNRTHFPYISNS